MVLGVADAVEDGVAHVDVGRGHVDAGAEDVGAVGELASPHTVKQIEVFFRWTVPMGTLPAGVGQGATVVANLLGSEAVNVGVAVQDELLGVLVQLLKIVGGVVEVLAPVETEPADVGQNGLDVLDILACGVGVVEAHVAPGARELLADSEIKADGLGVADVQIAVGFGRKAGDDAAVVGAGGLIVGDDAADEVGGFIPPGIIGLNGHGYRSL